MTSVLQAVRRWMTPPTMPDPDEARLARIVHTLTVVILASLFVPTLLRWQGVVLRPIFFALTAEQAILVVAYLLNRRGKVRAALVLILFSLLALVVFIVASSDDGSHDVSAFVLPALLVVASILLDHRIFLAFATVTIVLLASVMSAEVMGLMTSNLSSFTTVFDVLEGAMIMGITALAVGLLIQNMRSSLERARTSEAALARSHEELQRQSQRLTESDINGRFVYVNGAAARLSGYPLDDLLGKDFFDFCLPEDRSRIRRAFFRQYHEQDPSRSYEVALRSRTGRIHWVSMNVTLELREGSLSGFHVVARDITDRKAAEDEVRRLNQQLEQRVHDRTSELEATMAELQRISYTVSHDLRAPLRHIGAYAEMSRTRPAVRDDAFAPGYLQTIAFSAKWMGMLVDGLIEYLSIGQTDVQYGQVRLDQVVAEVRRELEPETAGRVIDWKVGPLPSVVGDRRLLRQALHNILGNAVKFTQSRDVATIEVGEVPRETPTGEHRIFVKDNGIGFDPQYQDRLFGLFERLHSRAEHAGAGIGLANVRRIMHRHGGAVWAEGAIDGGATITFSLPHEARRAVSGQVPGGRAGSGVQDAG
jgi:PAS domain S-box-containing protein